MNDNIVPLRLVPVAAKPEAVPAETARPTDAGDAMLKAYEGKLVEALVIGLNADGSVMMNCTHGLRSATWLTECAKKMLMEQTFNVS